ncbi:MAG: sigma-54-dependent Fis family transcriptional regulator [Gammaproteobacteria bacterium]|nr:sigma-54-dependent Fis family transcriptional regulator [Gammaproteobacteria bacterium]
MSHILIIEDEAVIRQALRRLFLRRGYRVDEADSIEQASQDPRLRNYDLVLCDLRLPGAPGTAIIPLVPDTPVLIMTSYASVRSAVDSMKRGAVDYISKPLDHDELLSLVERILGESRRQQQPAPTPLDNTQSAPIGDMIGNCSAMIELGNRIRKVAPTDTTVLILGESGTGKELVARALHQQSHRRNATLVSVNCASIPEQLIESELFGHTEGAFSGATNSHTGVIESANNATLFLDEIGELPLTAQARLLRVLQNGEIRRVGSEHPIQVDIRLLAATHRDLKQLVQEGHFRSDLYFRLRVVELTLPPLRERGGDIAQLAAFMLNKVCAQLDRPPMKLTQSALDCILAYPWPGNIRELENAMERAVILSDGNEITADLLAIEGPGEQPGTALERPIDGDLSLEEYFRRFVLEHQDTTTETELAKRLGISRKALWEKRQRLGIPRPKGGN